MNNERKGSKMKFLSLLYIIVIYIMLNNTVHAINVATFESEPPVHYPQCLKILCNEFESILNSASQYGANFKRKKKIKENFPGYDADQIQEAKDLELKIHIENFLTNRKECIKNYIPELYSVLEFNAGNNVIRLLNVLNEKFFVTKNLDKIKRKITSKAIFYLKSNNEFSLDTKSNDPIKENQNTECISNTENLIGAIYKLEKEIEEIRQQKNFHISLLVISSLLGVLFVIIAVYVWKLHGLFLFNQKQIADNALIKQNIENQFNKKINNLSNDIQKITTKIKQISISKEYKHKSINTNKQNKLPDEDSISKLSSEYNKICQDEGSKFIKEWKPIFYKLSNDDKKKFLEAKEPDEADYWLINYNRDNIIVPSYRSIMELEKLPRSSMQHSFHLYVNTEIYSIVEGYKLKIKEFAIIKKGEISINNIHQKGKLEIPAKDKKTT